MSHLCFRETSATCKESHGIILFDPKLAEEDILTGHRRSNITRTILIISVVLCSVTYQIASGAVVQSGAFQNLPEDYTGEDDEPTTPYMMMSWFLATEMSEAAATQGEKQVRACF
eukprot:1190892-Prorocentrum_minimum.AAC.6